MVANRNSDLLDDLLADDCVFFSPVVHTPQEGKARTRLYLAAAIAVFGDSFNYVRELVGDHQAVLEFTAEHDGILINGVDIIDWNPQGQITRFKVMVRPLKAVNLLHEQMRAMLESLATSAGSGGC